MKTTLFWFHHKEVFTHPYVTEDFKELIEQNGIKGFKFICVWQDDKE